MEISTAPRSAVWRGRGQPRREVPEQIRNLVESTYRSNRVITVDVNLDDPAEVKQAREFLTLIRSYANSKGKRIIVQRRDMGARILARMVDELPKKEA